MLEMIEWLALAVMVKSAAITPLWRLRQREVLETDIDHAWNTAWMLPEQMRKIQGDVKVLAANTATPELLLTNGFGLVSYVGSDGVLRTERAMTPESNDSPVVGGPPVGNVIPLFGRIGGG